MKLEEALTSLELGRRLKELGVNQDSQLGWREKMSMKGVSKWRICDKYDIFADDEICSAFSVAELSEIIRKMVKTSRSETLQIEWYKNEWFVNCVLAIGSHCTYNKKLADALASMLIYLLEDKLGER